jgi:hypothetical protein
VGSATTPTPDASQASTGKDAATVDAARRDDSQAADAGVPDGATDASDASTDAAAPRGYGDASTTYPAFTPDVPLLQSQGGATLASPRFVTVTWPGEPNAAALESFGDDLGPSAYWALTTQEYGVGPGSSGPGAHVRLTEQPINAWSDTALAAWVSDHAANYSTYGFPAPDGNTVYTLYLSTSTSITVQGTDGCQQGIGGYHSSVVVGGTDVAYAVILQCNGAALDQATSSASHELVEAATDPHPNDIQGYYGFDSDHLAWDIFQQFQDEVADACEFYYGASGSFYTATLPVIEYADAGTDGSDGGAGFDAGSLLVPDAGTASFSVQRTWSNASATAGHDPYVPVAAGPYYSVTPLNLEAIQLNLSGIGGSSNAKTLGYYIPVGTTRTFAVGYHSDGPTSGPWTLTAREGNPLLGGAQTSHLTISIDNGTGQNGDVAYITVTVNAVDASMHGELLSIMSRLAGGARTFVPILIGN